MREDEHLALVQVSAIEVYNYVCIYFVDDGLEWPQSDFNHATRISQNGGLFIRLAAD